MVVRTGQILAKEIDKKSEPILNQYGIDAGMNEVKVDKKTIDLAKKWHSMDKKKVETAFNEMKLDSPVFIQKHLLNVKHTDYEDIEKTINISNDDVCTKRQESSRKSLNDEQKKKRAIEKSKEKQRSGGRKNQKKRKLLYHNTTHFEYSRQTYLMIGHTLVKQVKYIIAFLLNNSGLDKNWVFFLDGQKTLYACIHKRFWWKPVMMVLDWYHLDKRLSKQMYYALKTCDERDEIQLRLRDYLWYGLTEQAIDYIDQIEKQVIKNEKELDNLKKYIKRNIPYIKNYALRKQLGLQLSSNRVEKANDQLVSSRQKNSTMSFTRNGSAGLALMTCIAKNGDQQNWIQKGNISFKFAA